MKAHVFRFAAAGLMAFGLCGLWVPVNTAGQGTDEMAEIAKKLNNPVASIISLPFQNNFDFGGGPHDNGFQYKLNVQPVIPFTLNEHWNLITRTIVPFIY